MMTDTVQRLIQYLHQEIDAYYPAEEVEAIIYLIFKHKLNFSRADVHLKSAANVSKSVVDEIENMVLDLKKFRPLQYILGETSFYGTIIRVNEAVLIPRPETEELVEWILTEHGNEKLSLIDLGTGSGCIPVAICKNRKSWQVSAMDISPDAISLASENALQNEVKIDFFLDDLLNLSPELLSKRFNLIVSNPPYITVEQKDLMQPNVLNFEPHLALFAEGNDPLIFYRKIAAFARECLIPGGAVYVEINEACSEETSNIFKKVGFETVLKKDIHEKFRMLKAFIPLQ